MKKIFISWIVFLSIIITSITPVFAESYDYVGGSFDWLYLSNVERKDRVQEIFKIMFPKGYVTNFPRGFLKQKLKNY